jgi:putative ABC transport system permease protein
MQPVREFARSRRLCESPSYEYQVEGLLQDLAHSLRMFRRNPGFTIAAIAALTLGIGANTAIFTVVNAVLFKPVAFPDPDRLVMLMTTSPWVGSVSWATPARFAHWRSQTSVIQDVTAFHTVLVNLTSGDKPEQLRAGQVSADYFRLFGAPIIQGRSFSAAEDRPNGDKVVVLSHALWARRFASDPRVIGRTTSLGGDPYVIIGVVGPSFNVGEFGPPPALWTPFQLDPNTADQATFFEVAARLKPGVTLDQAKARLQLSANEFRAKFPTALHPRVSFSVTPFQDAFVKDVRASLLVLVGAVSLVLLIACANVANLQLVRASARQREIAIRSALGASRRRLLRQLLAESVVLSLTGGASGLALGTAAVRALLAVNTAGLPRLGDHGSAAGLDWRVLTFTLLVSLGTGIVFGLLPALQGARVDLNTTLKESGGPLGTAFRHNRTRAVLVVAEIALALILLVGSALLIRTSIALRSVDPGFESHHVLTMRMSLTGTRFLTSAGIARTVCDVTDRLNALPGVELASATCCIPVQGGFGLPFTIAGRPLGDGPYHGQGGWFTVSPGYFEVFKIPVARGRTFGDRDDGSGPPVVIINESMAKAFWNNGSDLMNDRLVIGKGLTPAFDNQPAREIVGIVADSRDNGLNRDPGPMMFIPQAQKPDAFVPPMAWVVRTRGEPRAMSDAIQDQIRQATGLPVSDVRTMDEIVALSTSREQFNMLVMTVFGGSALLLAAIGIYGVMAYSVAQRTQEIGIRLALGTGGSAVRRMVLVQGLRLAVIGVVIGLFSSYGLTRFIASFLFGVNALDPVVFASIPVLLTAVALLAVWVPAQRASRVDPVIALRSQ